MQTTTYTVDELDTLRAQLRVKGGESFKEVPCQHDGTLFRADWSGLLGTTHCSMQCLPLRAGGWIVVQSMLVDKPAPVKEPA